jgi:nitrite reductase (NADH) small subunit
VSEWRDAGSVDEVVKAGKVVVGEDPPVLVVWHEGAPYAFHDICIHKERSLAKGVILNGRVICPGHQWAFDIESGYCKARERFQPTFEVEVRDGRIMVDVSAPRAVETPVDVD